MKDLSEFEKGQITIGETAGSENDDRWGNTSPGYYHSLVWEVIITWILVQLQKKKKIACMLCLFSESEFSFHKLHLLVCLFSLFPVFAPPFTFLYCLFSTSYNFFICISYYWIIYYAFCLGMWSIYSHSTEAPKSLLDFSASMWRIGASLKMTDCYQFMGDRLKEQESRSIQ